MLAVFATNIEPFAIDVNPVPPSLTPRVPVIEEAPRSTAISELSITRPPFAFKSTEISSAATSIPSPATALIVLPFLVNPVPAVICPHQKIVRILVQYYLV